MLQRVVGIDGLGLGGQAVQIVECALGKDTVVAPGTAFLDRLAVQLGPAGVIALLVQGVDSPAEGTAELVDTGPALDPVGAQDLDDAAGADLGLPGRIVGVDIVPGGRNLRIFVVVELVQILGTGGFEPDIAAAGAALGRVEGAVIGAACRVAVFNQGGEK